MAKGMMQAISDYLVELLEGLIDENADPILGAIIDYAPGAEAFDATPIAIVLPREQPGEYATTAQNDRMEGFEIFVAIPLEEGISRKKLFRNMRTISDAIRNAIDDTQDFGGLSSDDGKSRVYGVKPASAGWEFGDIGNGEALICQIDLTVKYTYDFR